ncbi:MAG: hypothetical protein LBH92_05040 [Bacteroidales bacterium]|jgi:hypothetical protein|nr:hypothetical protein [Bacteroidales bacterium]
MKTSIKKILSIVLLNLIVWSGFAQEQKNWLSISFGTVIPSNDFKGKVFMDSILRCGFAKPGFGLNITYTNQLSNNFGLTVMAAGNTNSSNVTALQKELDNLVKGDIEIGENSSGEASFGRWMTGMLLVGPNINFHLAHHFMLEIRGMLGVGMGQSPEYNYVITLAKPVEYINRIEFKQQSDHTLGFAWNVGLGLKYRFDRFFVRANFDYSGSHLKYDDVNFQIYKIFTNSETPDYINRTSKLWIQTDIMQITGGIGYLF